jgi:malonate-semialdehyde dehydrogenase (acetylating) / methylmalonate-semialdehyde dehydrogenase
MQASEVSSRAAAAGVIRVQNLIGGQWVDAPGAELIDTFNPATGEVIGQVPLSRGADVDRAVQAAMRAFAGWKETPVVQRARIMIRYRQKIEDNFDDLVRIITMNQGKTHAEARGSVMRAIECVEVAIAGPSLLMGGYGLENVGSRGVDSHVVRQPIGVCAIITPFNFPAMVPMMFLPFALVAGNTVVLKPSEQVPLIQKRLSELLEECDLPPGVCNVVNGGREAVEAICDHPEIRAVSFVGSSHVARAVYQRATHSGKRAQCFGGAKNLVVVMPDVNLDDATRAIAESFFVCAGQRCLAASVLVPVGDIHKAARERMVDLARSYKLGDGAVEGTTMGPVVSALSRDRINGMIERGVGSGGSLVLDGRPTRVEDRPGGYFVAPSIFDAVTPEMEMATEEVFGPVAAIAPVKTLDDALELMNRIPKANAASIFTTSGKAAREFSHRSVAPMVGVNIGVPAPMAYFPFGGAKESFFGDVKAHGRDGFDFFTEKKQTIYRWV